jgi:hypothetical protein
MLWDQIDNSLLVRQNETYRRRLTATRWVAAASLVLASLAGTGWWAHRASDMAGTEVATATERSATSGANSSVASTSASAGNGSRLNTMGAEDATSNASTGAASASAEGSYRAGAQGTLANTPTRNSGFGPASVRSGLERNLTGPTTAQDGRNGVADESSVVAAPQSGAATMAYTSSPNYGPRSSQSAGSVAAGLGGNDGNAALSSITDETSVLATASGVAAVSASAVAGAEPTGLLTTRTAALSLANPVAVPSGLAALSLPEAESVPAIDAHKWRYGVSYTAGGFNPNINFSRKGIESDYGYNPALGADSPALTEAAAAQYREHLRPGFSQRVALLATRRLTGRWSVRTGAELSQATAQSASSLSFLGEQLPDLGQSIASTMRTTDFRYRLASLPMEVRYDNPVKRGWSLYGRLGGVMSALLGVRSEVEGEPEATKTYSIASAAGPYRRVLGSLRGGVGAQFRPGTGNWAFSLGPVGELGLVPLNAHPAQSYLAQSRPYSFGVEAGVEFGR